MERETEIGQLKLCKGESKLRKACEREASVDILYRIKDTRAIGLGHTLPARNPPICLVTGTLC